MTDGHPYYRTIPISPSSDEDAVQLADESDLIEMSPQFHSEEKPSENPLEENEESEEAVLRRRLLEKRHKRARIIWNESEEKYVEQKHQKKMAANSTSINCESVTKQLIIAGSSQSSEKQPREQVQTEKRERATASTHTTTSKSSASCISTKISKQSTSQLAQQSEKKRLAVGVEKSGETRSERSEKSTLREQHRHRQKPSSSSSLGHFRSHHNQQQYRRKEQKQKAVGDEIVVSSEQKFGAGLEKKEQGDQRQKAKKRPKISSGSSSAAENGERRKETPKFLHADRTGVKDEEMQKDDDAKSNQEIIEAELELEKEEEEERELTEHHSHKSLSKPHVQSAPPSPSMKAQKYSKFESSPEMSSDEEGGGKFLKGEEPQGMDVEEPFPAQNEFKVAGAVNDEENGMFDDLLENKNFELLTEDEKALLPLEKLNQMESDYQRRLIAKLPVYYPGISGCRNVVEYECLNKISEGTYGVVYRAQEKRTDEIVALKRLKMEKESQGFPITSLREINMLLKCGTHPNVLNVREVVIGSNMDKIFLVMEYIEHDMKSLMDLMKSRNKRWTISQVKTLLRQLLSGIEHMHENYVMHRDLKTSNLLLSHRGILKIGDFGLAREFGEPLKRYTAVVVTLWYRSPELLLGTRLYSTPVDMWSIGCVFGEFLKMETLFAGRAENEQLQKIFKVVGTPNEQVWPGCMALPGMRSFVFAETPPNQLRKKFCAELTEEDGGFELMNGLLALDPSKRLTAKQALTSNWFQKDPQPAPPSSFPTWPAKSEHNKRPPNEPSAPRKSIGGFTLKFDLPKF